MAGPRTLRAEPNALNKKPRTAAQRRSVSTWNQVAHRRLRLFACETTDQSDAKPKPEPKAPTPRSFKAQHQPTPLLNPLSDMALRPRTSKRARPQTSPTAAKFASGDENMQLLYFRQPNVSDNQQLDDPQPRRKRAMVSANLRFLEKMPPLRDYQRGRFGRRGGVDGGDGGGSLWMRALEESMEETSFVTREAPTCAALVAPVPIPVDNRRNNQFVPVPVAVLGAGRVGGMPAAVATSSTFSRSADEDAVRRRRLFALQAARGSGKDDEARPATEGLCEMSRF